MIDRIEYLRSQVIHKYIGTSYSIRLKLYDDIININNNINNNNFILNNKIINNFTNYKLLSKCLEGSKGWIFCC